jgi:putative regulator of septum formation
VAEAWTCSQCGTVNKPSFVVCHECGQVRPDLDRTPTAGMPESHAADATVTPLASPLDSPIDSPVQPEGDPAAAAAAGGIPGWTPPPEWTRAPAGSASPAGPSEGWAASQGTNAPDQSAVSSAGSSSAGWAWPDTSHVPSPGVAPPAADAMPGWTAAAAPQRSILRRIPIGWLIVIVLVAGGAVVGWYFNAARSSSGEIDKAGDLKATDLRVGDCFDLKDANVDAIDDVRAVPCTTQHTYELFFAGRMPDGDYPSDDAFDAWTTTNCAPAFTTYVGRPYEQSTLEVYFLVPSKDSWGSGDRTVQCALYPQNNAHPTTSLKGSQQ